MIDLMQNWIRALVSASVIAALAKQLTPPGPVKRVTVFVSGIMLLSTLLSPALKADMSTFSCALAGYRSTVAELTQQMEEREDRLLRVYIEERTCAYILDEAQGLGLSGLEVSVRAKWREESWVPHEVYITGQATREQRDRLAKTLLINLGVPPERLFWDG